MKAQQNQCVLPAAAVTAAALLEMNHDHTDCSSAKENSTKGSVNVVSVVRWSLTKAANAPPVWAVTAMSA